MKCLNKGQDGKLCGFQLDPLYKFCPSCGSAVPEESQSTTRRSSRQRIVKTAQELLGGARGKSRKVATVTSNTLSPTLKGPTQQGRGNGQSPTKTESVTKPPSDPAPRRGRSAGMGLESPSPAAKQPAGGAVMHEKPVAVSTRRSTRVIQAQASPTEKETQRADKPDCKPEESPSRMTSITRTRSKKKSSEDVNSSGGTTGILRTPTKQGKVSAGTSREGGRKREESARGSAESVTPATSEGPKAATSDVPPTSSVTAADAAVTESAEKDQSPVVMGKKRKKVVCKSPESTNTALNDNTTAESPAKKFQIIETLADQVDPVSTPAATVASILEPEPPVQQTSDKIEESVDDSHNVIVLGSVPASAPSSISPETRNDTEEAKAEPKMSYTFRLISDTENEDKILVELVEHDQQKGQQEKAVEFDPEPVRSDPEIDELIKSLKPVAKFEDYSEVIYLKLSDGTPLVGDKMHSCKQCDFYCSLKKDMIAHLREKHGGFEPWKCPKCDYTAELKVGVVNHLASHSSVMPFTCTVCGKDFRHKQKLKLHMKYHMDLRDFECPHCDLAFHESRTLKNHIQRNHRTGKVSTGSKIVGVKKTTRRTVDYLKKQLENAQQDDTDSQAEVEGEALESTASQGTENAKEAPTTSTKTALSPAEEELISLVENAPKPKIKISKRDRTTQGDTDLGSHFNVKPIGDGINHVWECKLCSGVSRSKTEAFDHIMNEHKDVKLFSCDLCSYSTRHRSSLYLHKKTHSDDLPYACSLCERRFKIKTNLRRHYNTHTNERNFQCPHCDKGFNNKDDVSKHVKRMHTERDGDSMFKCDICDKMFKVVADLNRHQRTHVQSRTLPCPYCNQLYKTKESLNMHIRSHTTEYYCQICDKQIGSHSSFMAHKKLHDPEYHGYKCMMCDKILQSKGSWQIHMRVIHSSERPFKCDICAKSFKLKVHLERHRLRHSDVKPHQCSVCAFSCKRQEALKVHMRVHSEEKPYTCIQCGKGYTQKHALEAHIQMQHDERQFECGLCGSIFKALFQLQRHIRKYHSEHSNESLSMTEVTHTVTSSQESTPADVASINLLANMATSSGIELSSEALSSAILSCETCQETFTTQHSLALHILTRHMDQKLISGGVGVMLTTPGSSGSSTLIAVNPGEDEEGVAVPAADAASQEVVETELVEVPMDGETIIVSQATENVEGEVTAQEVNQ